MMTNSCGTILQFEAGLTRHIEPDGVGRGPSTERLVRLKPEVVVARVAQLHRPNLDGAAGIAAANVAESPDSLDAELITF